MPDYTFQYLYTIDSSAQTFSHLDITEIVRGVRFEKTVGDEFLIKSGDITITTTEPLPFSIIASTHNWLVVRRNNLLFGVYSIGNLATYDYSFRSRNDKDGLHEITLPSIDKVFFDNLAQQLIEYDTNTQMWNYDLGTAIIEIQRIRAKDSSGTYSIDAFDRAGFSLGDMILAMTLKTNNFGYSMTQPVIPIPLDGDDDLPILYRGGSLDHNISTDQQIIDHTWTGYEFSWFDLFKLASFAFNAFIRVTPTISGSPEKLNIGINLIPRIEEAVASPDTATWIERRFVRHKYRINGVKLTGGNFEYQQGNLNSGSVFEKNVEINDPDENIDLTGDSLFWSVGDYDSGNDDYSILDGSDNPRPYFASGLVEQYYDRMITDGHGYEGTILFNGERELDQISVDSETMQIVRLNINERDIAKVEGIVI
jgi:hypothetical protein